MSTKTDSKLKKLLDLHTPGAVILASWLERQGISRSLQARYRSSGWLESVGTGALKRPHDVVTWEGALYALQTQADLPIHVGAISALALQGFSHYLRLGQEEIFLFSPRGVNLPAWFMKADWMVSIRHHSTSVLPPGGGLVQHEAKMFTVKISGPERAMLECLHLAPKVFDLLECYEVMEGLANLRPDLVTEMLQSCRSIKAKRLFLYLAEKAQHRWLDYVDRSAVDLGKGDRSVAAAGGVYVSRYKLVVPEALADR